MAVIANVDMTAPSSGIILVTGEHGYPECPQALLGKDIDGQWYLEDAYGDLDKGGEATRDDFYNTADEVDEVVRKWLAYLDLTDVEIRTIIEYNQGD